MANMTSARLVGVAVLGLMGAMGDLHPSVALDRARITPEIVIVAVAPRHDRPLIVYSPLAYVGATVTAPTAIRHLDLRLDGLRVTPAISGRDATHLSVFYQPRHWACGGHNVRLDIWDAAGAHAWRTWRFRLTAAS